MNRSKFYSGRNEEQIEVRECLLSFGAEYFVFQFAIQKYIKIKVYRNTFLPVAYGCETLSLTFREVCRLRVFENRELSKIYGPKRDEVKKRLEKTI